MVQKMTNNKLIHGDCLDVMNQIEANSIDMILCHLPYGTIACKWDVVIPFDLLWEHYNRLIKPNGAILLFGNQPFTSALIMSNIKMFKYELIWDKCVGGAFVLAKKRILPAHENILLFSNKNTYNPQMSIKPIKDRRPERGLATCTNETIKTSSGIRKKSDEYREDLKYPTSVLYYPKQMKECNNTKRVHPTQKPVDLCEFLIRTYSNEGDIILDNCMGSGSTGVACMNTNRNFIGIEQDEKYFKIAQQRINKQG